MPGTKVCRLAAAAIAIYLTFTACNAGNAPLSTICKAVQDAGGDLILIPSLQDSDGRLPRGEPIAITVSVTNCGEGPVRRFYRDSQRYDLTIEDFESREIWRWSHGKGFAQVLGEKTFQPGETVTYMEVWDQRTNEGQLVDPGVYQLLVVDIGCQDQSLEDCELGSANVIEVTP